MKTNKKIRIGVLFGGRSAEHEVSLVSAASVIANLDKKKYKIVPIGISKQGQWFVGDATLRLFKQDRPLPAELRVLLAPEPGESGLIKLTRPSKLQAKVDVIFPVLHGTFGEDGTIQGLLELANLPYVGAGVLGSAVGMDKIMQKMVFRANNLPTPDFIYTTNYHYQAKLGRFIRQVISQIGFPCFVKPANLGSSVGISKVRHQLELAPAIKLAFKYDRKVIVEKGIADAWEIECSVLGNDEPIASIAGQVISSNEFYDYNAKYVDGKSRLIIPAPLSAGVMAKVKKIAVLAFQSLDLCGMARVDFLLQPAGQRLFISEVNTIPGFTNISMYPKLWQASGLSYGKLLDKLINLALARFKVKSKLFTNYQPTSLWYR